MVEIQEIIEVPFHDVDMMGIAWHGHYVKYFEIGRCALLKKIDYGYMRMHDSGYAWPVIDMRIRYAKPCRFQQKICVKAKLVEWENRLKIDYLITDVETGQRLTKGYSIQVAVDMESQEMLFASPAILLQKLGLATDA